MLSIVCNSDCSLLGVTIDTRSIDNTSSHKVTSSAAGESFCLI